LGDGEEVKKAGLAKTTEAKPVRGVEREDWGV